MEIHYLRALGPMIAALMVAALTERTAGTRALLSRWFKWRVEVRYYAFAVLAPAALFALAVLINRVATGIWSDLSLLGEADYLPYLGPLGALLLWFLTYGLGEETGWRGYALPHLQRKHSATTATLILAIVWAFWHIPAFFYRDTYIQMGLLGFPMFLVSITFATMVFTWLYNSTGGSLLLVILFHAFFNWLSVSEAGGASVGIVMSVPVILWAIFVVRRYGPENASPIHRQAAKY
jgi:membrane protease YdiL (CAAX protease family)